MKPITDIGALPGDRPRSSERPGLRISPLLSALVLLLIAPMAHAQLSGDWFTVAGGGGTSTGGQLGLSGTAGQSDAGNMSGGSYVLYGGFWGIAATWPTAADHHLLQRLGHRLLALDLPGLRARAGRQPRQSHLEPSGIAANRN